MSQTILGTEPELPLYEAGITDFMLKENEVEKDKII